MDNVEAKVKELKAYLRKAKIAFQDVTLDGRVSLRLDDDNYITTRSGYFKRFESLGISMISFGVIEKLLGEIATAVNFEVNSSRYIEKQKLNELMIRTNKTIRNKKVDVRFTNASSFGGYSDTRNSIVLYDPSTESIDDYLKIVPGINYHELGHIFFTCSIRALSNDVKRVIDYYEPDFNDMSKSKQQDLLGAVMGIINALEDARIENLMGNKFGFVIPYFKKTIFDFLFSSVLEKIDHGEEVTEVDCALIAGRKYLDDEYRKWIFEKYMDFKEDNTHEKAVRVNSYVNKFITLSWRKNRDEMIELALGFFFEFVYERMKKQREEQGQSLEEIIKEMLGEMVTGDNNFDSNDDVELDEHEAEVLKDMLSNISKQPQPQQKKPNKSKKEQAEEDEGIKRKLNQDSGNNETNIKENANELKDRLKGTPLGKKKNLSFSAHDVKIEMQQERIILEKKLKEFMNQCRNGYATRKKRGSVDVGEARRQEQRGGTKIFKQYRRNVRKALDIDIAFVLDCSGSMDEKQAEHLTAMELAARQLWITSNACRSVGADVKVFTYSSGDLGTIEELGSRSQYNVPYVQSSTIISPTLYMAENYLNCSQASSKWLISLSDGGIHDNEEHHQIITRMKRDGVTCGMISLMSSNASYYDELQSLFDENSKCYDYNLCFDVNSKKNIVTFFENIYKISLKGVGVAY